MVNACVARQYRKTRKRGGGRVSRVVQAHLARKYNRASLEDVAWLVVGVPRNALNVTAIINIYT